MVCCNSHVEDRQELLFTEWEKELQWITPLTDLNEAITSVFTMYPLFSFLILIFPRNLSLYLPLSSCVNTDMFIYES